MIDRVGPVRDFRTISAVIGLYHSATGAWPKSYKDACIYFGYSEQVDKWRISYSVVEYKDRYIITALGGDHILGTSDDQSFILIKQ